MENKIKMKLHTLVLTRLRKWAYTLILLYGTSASFCAENARSAEWVAEKHRSNQALLQNVTVFSEHSREPERTRQVQFNDGRFFGRTLPTKPDLEIPFLLFVKYKSKDSPVNTLELGCSEGLVSTKVPFCLNNPGKHLGIDLSEDALKQANSYAKQMLDPFKLKNTCSFLKMDCLKILEKAPKYRKKLTAIYSQNLIHFFNPAKTMEFFSIVDQLLAPGGKAFICADAPDIRYTADHYNEMAKNPENTFPGFMTKVNECVNWGTKGISMSGKPQITLPDPNTECKTEVLSVRESLVQIKGTSSIELKPVKAERTTVNYFTPEVFRRLLATFPGLEITETYFMNKEGLRLPDETILEDLSAVVILQKRI